jgi:hypothetical protein
MPNKKGCTPKKANKKKNLEICPDKETAIKENEKLAKLRQRKQESPKKATKKAWKKGLKQAKERSEEVVSTLHENNVTVELLNPEMAWTEIKCYEMNEELVLQPIYYPVRIKSYERSKSGSLDAKLSEEMKIILFCVDKNNNRKVIYPYSGAFSNSTFVINDSKYKIPSEPFNLKSLPGLNILQRFLDGENIHIRISMVLEDQEKTDLMRFQTYHAFMLK